MLPLIICILSGINCVITTLFCGLKIKCYYEIFKCCGCIKDTETISHYKETINVSDSTNIDIMGEQNPFDVV